jgi:hypothetical protein
MRQGGGNVAALEYIQVFSTILYQGEGDVATQTPVAQVMWSMTQRAYVDHNGAVQTMRPEYNLIGVVTGERAALRPDQAATIGAHSAAARGADVAPSTSQ